MSAGNFLIFAPVAPTSEFDSYPTHRAKYGQGGLRTVTSLAERDAIPSARREAGMEVCVFPPGGPASIWMLDEDLVSWFLVKIVGPTATDAIIIEESLAFQPYQPGVIRAVSSVDLGGLPAEASLWVDRCKVSSGLIRDEASDRFHFFIAAHTEYIEARAVIVKRM